MPEIGQMIKSRREAMGLSLKKLAIACGSSDSEIMKIENGTRKTLIGQHYVKSHVL